MKRLWIALAILAAVFTAALCNSLALSSFTGELTSLLTRAEAQAEAGLWEEAGRLTQSASDRWEDRGTYLHVTLRHADIDQIETSFREVHEFLTCQESGEYSAANARLLTQLALLSEAEQLNWKNIF